MSSIEGKWVWKTFTVVDKMERYLLIYYEISFVDIDQSFGFDSIINKEDEIKIIFKVSE